MIPIELRPANVMRNQTIEAVAEAERETGWWKLTCTNKIILQFRRLAHNGTQIRGEGFRTTKEGFDS
jgi:hypothetical protein